MKMAKSYTDLLSELFKKEEERNALREKLLKLDREICDKKKEIDDLISKDLPQIKLVVV